MSQPGAPDPEREVEFIRAMIEWTRDDVRQIYLRVTAAVALATLFVTGLPFDKLTALDRGSTRLLFAGIGCLLLGAVAHFSYMARVHRSQRKMARYLLTGSVQSAASEWERVWKIGRFLFLAGDILILLGVIALGAVLHDLLTLPS